jgi:hypothetical protein
MAMPESKQQLWRHENVNSLAQKHPGLRTTLIENSGPIRTTLGENGPTLI